jgi:hypothetical protein
VEKSKAKKAFDPLGGKTGRKDLADEVIRE